MHSACLSLFQVGRCSLTLLYLVAMNKLTSLIKIAQSKLLYGIKSRYGLESDITFQTSRGIGNGRTENKLGTHQLILNMSNHYIWLIERKIEDRRQKRREKTERKKEEEKSSRRKEIRGSTRIYSPLSLSCLLLLSTLPALLSTRLDSTPSPCLPLLSSSPSLLHFLNWLFF